MPLPWQVLLRNAPQLVALSRRLLENVRIGRAPGPPQASVQAADLARRVERLEGNETAQAELVQELARQVEALTEGLRVAARRSAWAAVIAAGAAVVAVVALALSG